MAEADWTELNNSQGSNVVARGATAGTVKPASTGTNNFAYGWNSLLATEGALGLFLDRANFNPMKNDAGNATGGSIRAAMKRGTAGGNQIGFAPMLFINLRSGIAGPAPAVEDKGYLLALEDSDPHRILLLKASPRGGGFTSANALRVGTNANQPETWLHIRLDAIFNANGDVVLKVFENDLTVNTIESPTWVAVPGMTDFIDDTLAVNTGETPLSGGFAGFAFFSNDLQKRGYIDHVEVFRQK